MVNRKCFILIGASGSGKSTTRRQIERVYGSNSPHDHANTVMTFSLDDCRCELFIQQPDVAIPKGPAPLYAAAYDWCLENQKKLDEFASSVWKNCLTYGDVIIVDNVNATKKSRNKWVTEAKWRGFEVVMVQVMTPLRVILERQSTRLDKNVPAAAVAAQYHKIEEPLLGSECDKYIVIDGTKEYTEMEWNELL